MKHMSECMTHDNLVYPKLYYMKNRFKSKRVLIDSSAQEEH